MLFPGYSSEPGRHAGEYVPPPHRLRRLLLVLGVLLLLFALAWPFIEPYLLETESVTLKAEDFPRSIGEVRIVYLTDIHKGGGFGSSRVAALIARVNQLNADIVLLGGDYAEDSAGAISFFKDSAICFFRL